MTESDRNETRQNGTSRDRKAITTAVIRNETGLHLRPARSFVDTASHYDSDIRVTFNDKTVSGKSIMELISLGAQPESVVTISAVGPDAEAAVAALAELVNGGFAPNG